MKPIRIALAVGADALTAVVRAGASRHVDRVQLVGRAPGATSGAGEDAGGELGRAHDDGLGGAGSVADLAPAIVRLHDRLAAALERPLDGARVRVTLLPPLVSARLIELPPLGRAEAEAVVRRDARRHFPLVTRSSVVAVREAAADASPGGWLAFGVEAEWIDGIRAAAERVGWRVDGVVPAHAAWLAAAEASTAGTRANAVVAVEGGTAHVLRLDGAAVTSLRRAPGGDPAAVTEILGRGPGTVALYADGRARSALRDALAANGWAVPAVAAGQESAARAAAEHAHGATTEVVSPGLAHARRQERRKLAVRLGAAAAAVLVAAAGLELWDARRDLAEVVAQRAAIREEVRPLAEIRDSLYAFGERARAAAEIEATAPRWTPVLVELARILPRDAHVQRLHARGDTVSIQVVSDRAGPALASLRRARTLRNVELNGVVDRELEGGTTTAERFTVSALLARDTIDAVGGFGRLDGGGTR